MEGAETTAVQHGEATGASRRRLGGLALSHWLLGAALAALFVPLALPTSPGNDESMWLYMGRIWADHGLPPYAGAVENKTPGIFTLHALSHVAFGTRVLPIRILAILAVVAGSLAVAATAGRIARAPAAHLAQLTFGLTMGWHLLEGRYVAQTETFMACFAAVSLLLLSRACGEPGRRAVGLLLLSAFALGVALAFKQVALFSGVGWLAFHALNAPGRFGWRRLVHGALLLGAGALAATLLSLVPLLVSGATVGDYVDGAWLILFDTPSSRAFTLAPDTSVVESVSEGLANQRYRFLDRVVQDRLTHFLPVFLLLALRRDLLRNRVVLGAMAWLLFDFLGANASGYYFGHQLKQVVPALAVLVGVLLAEALPALPAAVRRIPRPELVLLLVVALAYFPYEELKKGLERWRDEPSRTRALGEWIDETTEPDARVWCAGFGCNGVLAFSERRAPGRYFNTLFLDRDGAVEETLHDLREHPPAYVVMRGGEGSIPDEIRRHLRTHHGTGFRRSGYVLLTPSGR